MNVRKVGLSDLHQLRDIGIKSYIPHYSHLWKPNGLEWYLDRCFNTEFLQNELTDPNVEYYIISSEENDVGMVKLVLQKALPNSDIENALYLEKVYFVKEWIGRGVGQEMITFAVKRAVELKRDCVWLVAMDTSEKPIKAYEKSGFTIHFHNRLDFELMKEEFRGTIIMKRSVE